MSGISVRKLNLYIIEAGRLLLNALAFVMLLLNNTTTSRSRLF